MEWVQLPLGPLQTNCYILANENGECIIFDPGDDGDKLITYVKDQHLQPLAVLLTHAHFDHIGALSAVKKEWDIPIYQHELEKDWLTNPFLNGSQLFGFHTVAVSADNLIKDEKQLTIGPFSFQLFHTPGHSPGSLSFFIKEEKMVISGDTLFAGSIGRSDLPGGNGNQLLESIQKHLLTLPEETLVLPGHGPVTTIQNEKLTNPFLQ